MTLIEVQPKVWKAQRVTLVIGDREIVAKPITAEKTDTLTFVSQFLRFAQRRAVGAAARRWRREPPGRPKRPPAYLRCLTAGNDQP